MPPLIPDLGRGVDFSFCAATGGTGWRDLKKLKAARLSTQLPHEWACRQRKRSPAWGRLTHFSDLLSDPAFGGTGFLCLSAFFRADLHRDFYFFPPTSFGFNLLFFYQQLKVESKVNDSKPSLPADGRADGRRRNCKVPPRRSAVPHGSQRAVLSSLQFKVFPFGPFWKLFI